VRGASFSSLACSASLLPPHTSLSHPHSRRCACSRNILLKEGICRGGKQRFRSPLSCFFPLLALPVIPNASAILFGAYESLPPGTDVFRVVLRAVESGVSPPSFSSLAHRTDDTTTSAVLPDRSTVTLRPALLSDRRIQPLCAVVRERNRREGEEGRTVVFLSTLQHAKRDIHSAKLRPIVRTLSPVRLP
jgi:hypothetical protein